MAENIYKYDITDAEIPMSPKVTEKKVTFLGSDNNTFSNNGLTLGSLMAKEKSESIKPQKTKTTQMDNAYITYGHVDEGTPMISKQQQETASQAYVDWLQNERLKYMEAIFNPSSGSDTVSGKTESEQEVLDEGGVIEIIKDSRNLDAGAWT